MEVNHVRELAIRDPLKLFLGEIEKYPVLSREEEHELALKHYEEGDLEAARQLVVSNLRFVVKIGTTQAQRKLFQSIGKAKRELSISHDELTNEDLKNIADFFDVRERDVLGMEMRMAGRDFSLNMASSDHESITYLDSIPDSRENQEDIINSVETNEMIEDR